MLKDGLTAVLSLLLFATRPEQFNSAFETSRKIQTAKERNYRKANKTIYLKAGEKMIGIGSKIAH
jgi:hypothetical protein